MNFDPFMDAVNDVQDIFASENDFEQESKEVMRDFRSRGSNTNSYTPIATKYLTWKSADKCFNCYDTESKTTTTVNPDTEFIALTSTMSILGSRSVGKRGTPSFHWTNIYSNEFKDSKNEKVTVREVDKYEDSTNVLLEGTYTDIKEQVKNSPDMYFNLYVYAMVRGTEDIVRFAFNKSSRDVGFDVTNRDNMNGKAFKLTGSEERQNGSVQYNVPVVNFVDISQAEDTRAIEITREIDEKINRKRGL